MAADVQRERRLGDGASMSDYRSRLAGGATAVADAAVFPRGCVASPHHLASSAGAAVLARGGNAIDAAVATNLVLGVVMPFACGYGRDLFAIVWDGGVHAFEGCGRTPADASIEGVRERTGADLMPAFGPHAVSVPGAVDGWFSLLERWGTQTFGTLAAEALHYAEKGFELSANALRSLTNARALYADFPDWQAAYGNAPEQGVLVQPHLARTIGALAEDGRGAYYRGPIGEAIAGQVQALGGVMNRDDLAAHRGQWVTPLWQGYRDVDVLEMPPPTQGVTALQALAIVEATGDLPAPGVDRHHLLIEASKLALSERGEHVGDPDHMTLTPDELLSAGRIADLAARIDPGKAGTPAHARPALGGTIYLCAADSDGLMVSLIQSNFMGFGSGVTVPGWGINLQNRAGYMRLEHGAPDSYGPARRPMHTLIPGMVLRDGRPSLVFGNMGGDSQAQFHLQLLTKIIDDHEDIQRAISSPRWTVNATDWSVALEGGFDPDLATSLRARGHTVSETEGLSSLFGWAQAIQVTPHGYRGATDPRPDGAVIGH